MTIMAVLAMKIESYFRGTLSEAELVALLRKAKKRVSELHAK